MREASANHELCEDCVRQERSMERHRATIRDSRSSQRFNEFVVRGRRPATEVLERLRGTGGIIGGLALSKYYDGHDNDFLVCVTETNTREQIDALVAGLSTHA